MLSEGEAEINRTGEAAALRYLLDGDAALFQEEPGLLELLLAFILQWRDFEMPVPIHVECPASH